MANLFDDFDLDIQKETVSGSDGNEEAAPFTCMWTCPGGGQPPTVTLTQAGGQWSHCFCTR